MSTIEEVKDRIDIVDLVTESVQLRRSGKNYSAFCPFHPNVRTPAFVVFPETQTWRCFGQCNEGGDIFRFIMKKEGWDFSESLHYLAEKAGVQLRKTTPQEQEKDEENERLRQLLEDAVTFYRHNLLNTPAGQKALTYLRNRGLNDEIIEAFGLGYAPDAWDTALNHFKSKRISVEDILETGLITKRDDGKIYDRFRHRITFPIRDGRGRMAGFGGRVLNPEDLPKFINSPQTTLFDKGRLLYGLDRARRSIRSNDEVVIVEGYLDVIALHQHGYSNAVSPMGTALTEHQLRNMKRYTRRIVLALDADAAGNKATLRGLQVAREVLDRESDPVFDARGLLRHEGRLQADIRVTTLPQGMDPDDVVNHDTDDWERIMANAKPIVVHVMETLAADRDITDAKVKSQIASQVLPLIQDLPNPIERDTYIQQLARMLQIDERALRSEQRHQRPGRKRTRSSLRALEPTPDESPGDDIAAKIVSSSLSTHVLEAHCLGVLLRQPEFLYHIDRALQQTGLERMTPQDFQHADHQVMLRIVRDALEQDHAEPQHYILDNLPLELMEKADKHLEQTENLDPNEQRVLEDVLRTILSMRGRNLKQSIEHLRYLMEAAQEQGDIKVSQYQETMAQYISTRERLDQAKLELTKHNFTSHPIL